MDAAVNPTGMYIRRPSFGDVAYPMNYLVYIDRKPFKIGSPHDTRDLYLKKGKDNKLDGSWTFRQIF
ncbi:MAG: hypothetical protein NV67_15305 [Gammaproteobacteria bacterium (ex Lamellibrachia satsuma)]|nr:MAG: hypothetical protein NV67_15305 [Gammaproteobacteria bacterium (ex Lamellibrachia satsuma)]